MSTIAVNGRAYQFASLHGDGELFPEANGTLGPIFHTMGTPSPITHTMPALVYSTQPAPVSGEGAVTVETVPNTTASTEPAPTDPVFQEQWHFNFLGDIQKIWEEFDGTGVHVGIYDDGVEYTHPDLAANYDVDSQLIIHLYEQDWYLDALEWTQYGYPHGTAVAGLIAAARNGEGTVGVAYGSTITGVPIFGGMADINYSFDGFIAALAQADKFDIISNSWGATAAFYQSSIPYNEQINAGWMHAVEEGRVDDEGNKLGTIIVKAAGNDNLNTNGDQANTTRATIIVGAYDATGDASYYSSFGANLLISSPSSGDRVEFWSPEGTVNDPGLVTTDLAGWPGYNMEANPGADADYTDRFGGTSGATPIVSGVVSLILDANAALGWRDVQNILAYSAREIELIGEELGSLEILEAQQLVPKSKMVALRREAARLEGERGQLRASAAQAKGKVAEIELQILRIDQDFRTELVQDLTENQSKQAGLVERRVAAEDQLKRIDIRAPQSGTVHQLAVHTVGGVINAGEPVMLIVPEGDKLVVEAKIAPHDIDQALQSRSALIRFAAFNQRTTPEIRGNVSSIAADLTQDPRSGESYFVARIEIPDEELAKLESSKLVPGMPAEVHIHTQDRTALSFLVKPLQDQIAKAFKER